MPKVTSKLQLTAAQSHRRPVRIRPGDELQWIAAGKAIRVIPAGKNNRNEQERTVKERLELFDQATQRQRRRQAKAGKVVSPAVRGWKREELYGSSFPD